jgi:hypothetical protein
MRHGRRDPGYPNRESSKGDTYSYALAQFVPDKSPDRSMPYAVGIESYGEGRTCLKGQYCGSPDHGHNHGDEPETNFHVTACRAPSLFSSAVSVDSIRCSTNQIYTAPGLLNTSGPHPPSHTNSQYKIDPHWQVKILETRSTYLHLL